MDDSFEKDKKCGDEDEKDDYQEAEDEEEEEGGDEDRGDEEEDQDGDDEKDHGSGVELITDVLVYLFTHHIVDMKQLWRDIPLVCRDWCYARSAAVVKRKLVQTLWAQRSQQWKASECAMFFDGLAQFRMLRHRFQTTVATIVAHGRLRGVAWPHLSSLHALFDKSEWNKMGLHVWKHPNDAVKFIEGYVRSLDECLDMIEKPPPAVFLEDMILPCLQLLEGTRKEKAWAVLVDLGDKLTHLVRYLVGLDGAVRDQSLMGDSHCQVCELAEPSNFRKLTIQPETKLCKMCLRYRDLCLESRSAVLANLGQFVTIRAIVPPQSSANPEKMFCIYAGHPLLILTNRDLWWPEIEIECQHMCAKLVDPEHGIMRLSSNGLKCLLDNCSTGTILDEFIQQLRMAHVMSQSASYQYDCIPSEDVYLESSFEEGEEDCTSDDSGTSSEWISSNEEEDEDEI